jgi:hypothetical protein
LKKHFIKMQSVSIGSVFVMLSGDKEANFAPVEIFSSDSVGHVAERASTKFHWLVSANKIKLFLVNTNFAEAVQSGDESTGISASKLFFGTSLMHAGISNGSFLLARLPEESNIRVASWSRYLCSCMWRQHTTDQLLLAALAQQNAALAQQTAAMEQLPRRVAQILAESDDLGTIISVISDPQYEEDSRNWLPSQLLQRCGLVVVENIDVQRTNLVGLQWDFRAPVILARTEPHPNMELDAFEIFPSGTPSYLRPSASVEPRYLTPTKFGGAAHPPSGQYLALFEFTTADRWSKRAKRRDDSTFKTMASRLNERLAKSLDRAKDVGYISSNARITDLVAVIGVVAPTACTASMTFTMTNRSCGSHWRCCSYGLHSSMTFTMTRSDVPLLLKEMMDARRFVVFVKPKVTQPSSSRSSPSRESVA